MIYVHVPFCRSFCTYCDFYSEICSRTGSQQVQNRYLSDLLAEIHQRHLTCSPAQCLVETSQDEKTPENPCHPRHRKREGPIYGRGRAERDDSQGSFLPGYTDQADVKTLYIGGGTPSVLPVEMLEKIVEALGDREYEEFTVEVNPDDIVEKGLEYVQRLVAMGVNRISMGVQSFDDGILKWMNRRHDAAEAKEAYRLLRAGGVQNISIDLIFGLSQLSDETWERTIDEALAFGPEHISAYQLSIEEGSALGQMVRDGRYREAPDEDCRRQYDILCRKLAEAGFNHYEISNWARPGREAVHNSAYWRRVPYIGLGPGAHSLSPDGVRSWNSQDLSGWTSESEALTPDEIREETLMLALRTSRGLPLAQLRALAAPGSVDALLAEGSLQITASPTAAPFGPVADSISEPPGADPYARIPEDRFFVSDDIVARLI